MSNQLDYTTTYHHNYLLSGSYEHRGSENLMTGNLVHIKIKSDRYMTGLGRWYLKLFRGKYNTSQRIVIFYIIVPQLSGGVLVSIYAQQFLHFSYIKSKQFPGSALMMDLAEEISFWRKMETT